MVNFLYMSEPTKAYLIVNISFPISCNYLPISVVTIPKTNYAGEGQIWLHDRHKRHTTSRKYIFATQHTRTHARAHKILPTYYSSNVVTLSYMVIERFAVSSVCRQSKWNVRCSCVKSECFGKSETVPHPIASEYDSDLQEKNLT